MRVKMHIQRSALKFSDIDVDGKDDLIEEIVFEQGRDQRHLKACKTTVIYLFKKNKFHLKSRKTTKS
jgi:ribosomal silencing factor RsfS